MALFVPEQNFELRTSDFIGQEYRHQISRFPQKGSTPDGNFVALYMVCPVDGDNRYYTFGVVGGQTYTSEFNASTDFSYMLREFNNFFESPPAPLTFGNTLPGNEPVPTPTAGVC